MLTAKPIHPFPARMAAEIALDVLEQLPSGSSVLDPMAGSGTVLRAATAHGHKAQGFDSDPLAVLMARVWTTPLESDALTVAAKRLVTQAEKLGCSEIDLPWIDDDPETVAFVEFWFGSRQRLALRRLSYLLSNCSEEPAIADAMRVALSRIIVTKGRGASLARDASHSRPHRAWDEHDFEVNSAFLKSAERIAMHLGVHPPEGNANVCLGDARNLQTIPGNSFDAVITSPPYLNAIDYMRGHRLSLVWLGYPIGLLRSIRSENIGSERAPNADSPMAEVKRLISNVSELSALPARIQTMITRFAIDLTRVVSEICRVLRSNGQAVIVIGNSVLRGISIENDQLVIEIARRQGLELVRRHVRSLPASRRYLPPPATGESVLTKRMRTESVLVFVRP